MKRILWAWLITVPMLVTTLSNCGGGGGGSSNSGKSSTASGQVTLNGSGLAGVMVTMIGTGSSSTTTDASGNYSFTGVVSGSYTIIPFMVAYTFNPAYLSVTVNGANVTVQNFTAGGGINNVMSITVNGALCSSPNIYGINNPCVSVTVCIPGTPTCQTIDNILLDTGSSGLRIFKKALNANIQNNIGGGSLAECVQYGDGSAEWGPVQTVSVGLGGEPLITIPIMVIDPTFDSTYTGIPTVCTSANPLLDASPSEVGYNGLLGVGLYAQDCGSACQNNANIGQYYSCSGNTCIGTTVLNDNQVQNPVASLQEDNNGFIVKLPIVPADGLPSVTGYLVLGIGTQSNNIPPSTVTVYPVDDNPADAAYGDFYTSLSNTPSPNSFPYSFIDSGSNGLFFPSSTLPFCSSDQNWFCPTSTASFSATIEGYNRTPISQPVPFQIENFTTFINTNLSNWVFNDVGGPNAIDSGEFTWGLPFYLGRDVYHGIEKTSSTQLGTGPYWAY
ncbi:MAG: DUF3443 family protein [Syntrophales bacterium]|jgi:hypothetical protein